MTTTTAPAPDRSDDARVGLIRDTAKRIDAMIAAPAKAEGERVAAMKKAMEPVADEAAALRSKIKAIRAERKPLLDALAAVDYEAARFMLRKEDQLLQHLATAERKAREAREWLESAERELTEVPQRIAAFTVADLVPVIIERKYGLGDRMAGGPYRVYATVWNYRNGGRHLRSDLDMAANAFLQVQRRLSEDGALLSHPERAVRPDQVKRIEDSPNDGSVPRQETAVLAFNVFGDAGAA